MDSELRAIYHDVVRRNPEEPEFHQAVGAVLESLAPALAQRPELRRHRIVDRLCEPERQILFRVPWLDDAGNVRINRGFRVEFNSALGPYKGGLRFHPSLYLGTVKFLAFEQVLKNALTGMSLGGGKGGADFDPKGRSDGEIMRFCQSFMTELCRHLGQHTDVPAGDIGVGTTEIGYLFGQYRRITNRYESAVLTGKGAGWGGSLLQTEATGYGAVFFLQEMLETRGESLSGKTCIVSGAGSVALHAMEKLHELGARVVACSDSKGCLYDDQGVDHERVKQLKQEEGRPLKDYVERRRHARYEEGGRIWGVRCDVALPCATENELEEADAALLVGNGCSAVVEGANMPATPGAVRIFLDEGVLYGPGKAANAGGVVTSGLEMQQNVTRETWSFEHTERRLQGVMTAIHRTVADTAEAFGAPGNYVVGANVAGFLRTADAMLAQGLI